MSEKIKKISINEFEKAIESDCVHAVDAEWRGVSIHINTILSFAKALEFSNMVTEMCFASDTGEFIPEAQDFAIRCAIIQFYTNLTMPANLERKHEMVYGTDIIQFVVEYIDKNQFHPLLSAIDKKIDIRVKANIEALNAKMAEVAAGFETLEQKLGEIFGDIDGETVNKIAGAIANGNFDEDKLVEAVTAKHAGDK